VLPFLSHAAPIKLGANYDAVIAALGKPDGEINAGSHQILSYGKAQIKLKNGKVSSISPELQKLLDLREAEQAAIEAKRADGLVSYKGEWMQPYERNALILREKQQQAAQIALNKEESNWITDYDQALAMAKAQNKKILLNFTGSDWSEESILLEKEVFSQKQFLDYAKPRYILVKIDFPRRTQLPAYLKSQNKEVSEAFKVRKLPTVVVLNPDGKRYRTSGYVQGGPQAFVYSIQ
jgi:protein disulfide-isomerase